MGPPAAVQVLRESLYRGADEVILLTDKAFAGADTLATSYALSLGRAEARRRRPRALRPAGDRRRHRAGRPADGREARLPADHLREPYRRADGAGRGEAGSGAITATRSIEGGFETLTSTLPCLLTVTGEANDPRPPSVKLS